MAKIICGIIILSLALVVMPGCAGTSKLDLMALDKQITESLKQLSIDKMENWSFWSGVITEALRERADEVPSRVWTAIAMLDSLDAMSITSPLNDHGLGAALVLNMKVSMYVVSEALQEFAPEILEILLRML